MAGLPSGTVTFLFTDIEGSTRRWDIDAEGMRADLSRHDAIVKDAIARHQGSVFATGGDGFAAAFGRAGDALACATEAQTALADAACPPVRMALHTGEAEERDGDYFGPAVNRAARLMAIAHGGQIVCSRATADVVGDALPPGLSLVDLGEHRLRDLSRPEQIFQVNAAGLGTEFPPLVSLDAFPGNLPLQVSSFIGRERELARVAVTLRDARVVTLTGVGGVGKTRLAIQVAAEVLPEFREGAWLVELAPIRDAAAVPGAFAAVFGVTDRAGVSLEDALIEFLASKRLLIVVDNCEHLLGAAADLIELIERSCSGVQVLATSREGLALEGERVVPVPSLSEPPTDGDMVAAAQYDAVRLFVERAVAVDPDFELTVDNAEAVVQVCRRLDGIPLAIELAAARVGTMNPAELARGLDHRFDTLSGGRRRAVQRHQTLRAAIDWSYDLCSAPERRLLSRLAVFAGGCTRAAVEAVCGTPPIEARATFELLATLVARSLVVAERDHPETRYRLLETLREYGEERLAEHSETDMVRTAHAEYYTELAALLRDQLSGPDQIEVGRRFAAEHENFHAALNYAIDLDNADLALRLVFNLPTPQTQTGYTLQLPVASTFALTGVSDHFLYPIVLGVAAVQAAVHGDVETANARIAQSVEAARRLGDPDRWVENIACTARMFLAFGRGATHDAAGYADQAAELSKADNKLGAAAVALASAATFYAMCGDNQAALARATEGLAIARALGTPSFISLNLTALAAALVDEDPVQARVTLHESIEHRNKLGYENVGEVTQAVLISARLQDWPTTLAMAGPSIRHLHWQGTSPLLAAVINVTARALATEHPETAAILQGAARQLLTTMRPPGDTAPTNALPTGSSASSRTGESHDFVTDLRRDTTALLHKALTDARLRELRTQGEKMSPDDAIAYTLDAIAKATEHA